MRGLFLAVDQRLAILFNREEILESWYKFDVLLVLLSIAPGLGPEPTSYISRIRDISVKLQEIFKPIACPFPILVGTLDRIYYR
jgi:hypothetical protein